MNNNVVQSRVQMEPTLLKQLVNEVKETIATGVNIPANTTTVSFRAIDLWNIRRKGRFVNSGTRRKMNASLSVTHVSF